MNKFVELAFVLLLLPIIAHESFGYLGGDMIDQNSFSLGFDNLKTTSDIITINESDKTENLKRYIIFGHGSLNDLHSLTSGVSNSISSSNGFFSIVTMPENNISHLESAGLHIMEDFQLDFHSKYTEYNPHSKISEIGNLANSVQVHDLYNVTGKGVTCLLYTSPSPRD